MKNAIKNVHRASNSFKSIAGVFLEGPFLSKAQCGAQTPENILIPTPQVYEPLLETITSISGRRL